MKKLIKPVAVLLTIAMLFSLFTIGVYADENDSLTTDEYGFIDVGDTEIEYGVYNKNAENALVLLPGNGADMHGLDSNILKAMAPYYKVVTISPRGTGNTKLGTDDLTFELEAQDLNAVRDYLNIDTTYVYGFSDGGNLAIVFTLMYPERVSKLCIESPNINIFGTKTFTQLQIMWQYFILCIESRFKNDYETQRRKAIKGMMAHQPNLKFSDLEAISVPTLHIYAEHDMMFRTHSKNITKSIPNCEEIMIKGMGHSQALQTTQTIIGPALLDFYG